jgi:gliding motility-associated-like protein
MTKLLITIFLVFSLHCTFASHTYNGDLSYEYVGNATGIPNQYRVHFTLYYTLSGAVIPNSIIAEICSSCFATDSLTLMLDSGLIPVGNQIPCANNTNTFFANHYSGLVVLPGLCGDFSFQLDLGLRSQAIDNINSAGSSSMKLKVMLNNLQGTNSSPQFVSYPEFNYCVGQNAVWPNPFIESDADSVLITLATPLGGSGSCTAIPLAHTPMYTTTQPITTTPAQNASFIGNTPFLTFTPAALEVVTVRLEILEFRNDTTWGTTYLVGTATRDITLVIGLNCNPVAQSVLLDYNAPGIYLDPTSGLPTMDFWCHDSTFNLEFATPIRCTSIAADGSDFRMSTPNGLPVPIKSASAICDVFDETKTITFNLFNPITQNGDYILYSKKGTDGNTVINRCGFAMFEYDTLVLSVTNCSGIGINEAALNARIFIPNAFTPNGDGVNDFFKISIPEHEKGTFSLQIINRGGQLVHAKKEYTGQTWDGTQNGKPLPEGVYFVILTKTRQNSTQPEVIRQELTILR